MRRGVANRMAGRSVACVDRKVSIPTLSDGLVLHISPSLLCLSLIILSIPSVTLVPVVSLQGTGRYSIYVANYASGNIGPHALLEMDEAGSDLTKGIIALSDVAAEAGVNKYTGQLEKNKACDVLELAKLAPAFKLWLLCRWPWRGGWTNPKPDKVGCVL